MLLYIGSAYNYCMENSTSNYMDLASASTKRGTQLSNKPRKYLLLCHVIVKKYRSAPPARYKGDTYEGMYTGYRWR